jgi:hypothetical protein
VAAFCDRARRSGRQFVRRERSSSQKQLAAAAANATAKNSVAKAAKFKKAVAVAVASIRRDLSSDMSGPILSFKEFASLRATALSAANATFNFEIKGLERDDGAAAARAQAQAGLDAVVGEATAAMRGRVELAAVSIGEELKNRFVTNLQTDGVGSVPLGVREGGWGGVTAQTAALEAKMKRQEDDVRAAFKTQTAQWEGFSFDAKEVWVRRGGGGGVDVGRRSSRSKRRVCGRETRGR